MGMTRRGFLYLAGALVASVAVGPVVPALAVDGPQALAWTWTEEVMWGAYYDAERQAYMVQALWGDWMYAEYMDIDGHPREVEVPAEFKERALGAFDRLLRDLEARGMT